MRYLILIHAEEARFECMSPSESDAHMREHMEFHDAVHAAGAAQAAARLRPVAQSTTVRIRGGKTLVTDGPFAEAKEQVGGFYLIDVPDLDEAISWAKRIPAATFGAVEVRPVWEMADFLPPRA